MWSLAALLGAISVFKSKLSHEEEGMRSDSAPSRPTVTGSYCHLPVPSNLHKMGLLEISALLNEFLASTQRATAAFGLGQHGVTASGGDLGVPGCAPYVGVLCAQTCSTTAGNP